ncbi:MAG: DNA alkylation repair protein, partial [Pseudomonadota bacterium]
MNCDEIIRQLRSMTNPASIEGMARYGINPATALGVSIPSLRRIAKAVGRDHQIAGELWDSGIHEARILASMIEIRDLVTKDQAERWV